MVVACLSFMLFTAHALEGKRREPTSHLLSSNRTGAMIHVLSTYAICRVNALAASNLGLLLQAEHFSR